MQGIEFEEEKDATATTAKVLPHEKIERPSAMLQILEILGVSDKSTGNLILLGVATIFLVIAFFLYARVLRDSVPPQQSVEQISAQLKVMREMQAIQ
jgi:hypothetical protein